MKSATRPAAPVAAVWIPLAAELMVANVADSELALLYRIEHDLDLCVGLKVFLKAAW